ncbi:phosphoglucosamine mutase [Herbinix hemicellulosilytica]|uniref:Phosphoglucosamine mutase n=1 Tax=Herbinix hemicellulosilytica TaxID=1564487 RepID=A0A0H5SEF9_HERHM|nr:phosphoglucosamine mutase [Herbinix hemicellulosilytica]RBP57034.1 phosphoglucosamine mutase [Herbinix hemicellulosilytica]CRZ33241.1 Phosphoglucosamine mutase [Herbinix hemicellulosilytica]
MGKYFGTDGFRGEANVDLTVEHAYKVGRFLGHYYGKDHKAKIVIGKDTRRSSYMFEYSLVAGLTASGADAYLLHVTTTPSVSYVVRTEGFDCGIMISASHNPYYDNGIKIINRNGHKLEAEVEELIEAYIDSKEDTIPLATRENIGKTVDYAMGRNRYIGYLISLATRSFEGKRIGLDLANGSATSIAKGVFDALGAKTYVINGEPDGTNINRNCGSTHIEGLQKFVVENNLDVGFAYDGDADRCLAVDEKGNVITGDHILYMCSVYMKERNDLANNTVVTTIMSNMGLYKALDKKGISYEKTKVGDKYVYENMLANGHSIGGEQSGHIIFSKHATTGDGILTSLKIMEVMLESKAKLSELCKDLHIFPQVLENVRVKDKKAATGDPAVCELIERLGKELGNDGRIIVRESGTEPVIRVMAEAKTEELCRNVVEQIINMIKKQGHAK